MIDFNNNIYLGVASPDMERDLSNYYTKAQTRALVDTKQDIITGAASTITDSNLTVDRAVISNGSGKVAVSNVTSTELGYLSGVTSGVQTQLDNKASTSLNNLSADGQIIIDSQNGTISNCVLEIPQNIKVTLENNVLTVKSGSILTLTGSTYATATTNHDVARTYNSLADGRYFIFMAGNLGSLGAARKISEVDSGDTVPDSSSSLTAFYNTADKKMYQKENNVWTVWNVVYPLCIIEASDGAVSFAKDSKGNDMIFNGAGFIGHHAFVYPNVRKLICKGKADSKLNSYDELVNGLYIVDLGQSIGTRAVISRNGNTYFSNIYWEVDKYSDLVAQAGVQYCRETNYCYSYTNGIFNEQSSLALAYVTYDGTTVTDFTIRQPYQGARNLLTDDLYKQIGDVETLLATV